jgi:hypothetical protein
MSSTPVITIDPGNPDPSLIQEAAGLLRQGRILAYPTETFYGLGADAGNEAAIEKLFGIKGRSFSNPIPILHGSRRRTGQPGRGGPGNSAKAHGRILARPPDAGVSSGSIPVPAADGTHRTDRHSDIQPSHRPESGPGPWSAPDNHERQFVRREGVRDSSGGRPDNRLTSRRHR